MSKKANLTDVSTGYSSATTLNDNFNRLNEQLENTVSLDGSTPNAMQGDLDLNSNDLLNAGKIEVGELILGGEKTYTVGTTPKWEGAWTTGKAFVVNDLVSEAGSAYIALENHTSGIFSTDYMNSKWALFAQQGQAGAGTGDMLAANNLSDLTDNATSRNNLGLGTAAVTNSDQYATAAQGVRADFLLNPGNYATGDMLYFDGANFRRVAKGVDGQVLKMIGGVPAWGSTSQGGFNANQRWFNVSRSFDYGYQNTTGNPIMLYIFVTGGSVTVQTSTNNSTWDTALTGMSSDNGKIATIVIPHGQWYRFIGFGAFEVRILM